MKYDHIPSFSFSPLNFPHDFSNMSASYFMSSFPLLFIDKLQNIISIVHLYINVGTPTATLGTSRSPYLLKTKFLPSTFDYSMPIVP